MVREERRVRRVGSVWDQFMTQERRWRCGGSLGDCRWPRRCGMAAAASRGRAPRRLDKIWMHRIMLLTLWSVCCCGAMTSTLCGKRFDLQLMLGFFWDILLTRWLHVMLQCATERYRGSPQEHVCTVMFQLSILTFNIDSLIPFLRVHDWQLVVGNGTKMSTECSWIS